MKLRAKDQKTPTIEHVIDLSKFLTQNIGKMQSHQKSKLYKLMTQPTSPERSPAAAAGHRMLDNNVNNMKAVLKYQVKDTNHSQTISPFKDNEGGACYYDINKPYHSSMVGGGMNKE